jgi:AcrR family transcriptional regulator
MLSRQLGRPREHDQATRVSLLAAAERQIADGGTAAVSVRSVAEAAGTSTRAVYAVFGSKEGLLQALAARAFELLSEKVDSVAETADPIEDLFAAGFVGYRGFALEHPDLFRLVLGSALTNFRFGPEARAAGYASFARLIHRLDRAQKAGLLGEIDLNLVTFQLNAAAQGMTALELCGTFETSVAERLWREMYATLVGGWKAVAAAGAPTEARA